MNGPYENLIQSCHENEACEVATSSPTPRAVGNYRKRRGSGGGGGGGGHRCRTAVLIASLLGALVAIGISGWVLYFAPNRCKYATFVLDSDSLKPCDHPQRTLAPCWSNRSNLESSASYLTAYEYNNAVGPWKLGDVTEGRSDDMESSYCGFQFERQGTHLIVGQPGLYQLTAQVTFTDDNPAHLEWQVGHAEWIAVKRGRDAGAGPSQTRLEAVRRLAAGEKLSVHLDRGERRLATGAPATFITLVRL